MLRIHGIEPFTFNLRRKYHENAPMETLFKVLVEFQPITWQTKVDSADPTVVRPKFYLDDSKSFE